MDITTYFDPVDMKAITEGISSLGKYSFGFMVGKNKQQQNQDPLKNAQVALLGVPLTNGATQRETASAPNAIRRALYRLASVDPLLKVIDLGNLKPSKSHKGTLLALRDIVEHLRQLDIVVIVLGGSQELTLGICEPFITDRFFWLSSIDAVFDIKKGKESLNSSNFLSALFKKFPHLFQYSLIGYQQHLTGELFGRKFREKGNHLRLGELRENIKQAEQLLRNAHVLTFDMGAIKYCEAPGTSQKNPNGLRGEEACQLAHYAGLSPRLEVFGLFEMMVEKNDPITPALAAEIIWYFLKGVSKRKESQLQTAYKVEIEGMDHPVVFRHEWEIDRWWFDVPSVSGEVIKIACSEEDYRQAAANEIPERWLQFVQKMDKLSK